MFVFETKNNKTKHARGGSLFWHYNSTKASINAQIEHTVNIVHTCEHQIHVSNSSNVGYHNYYYHIQTSRTSTISHSRQSHVKRAVDRQIVPLELKGAKLPLQTGSLAPSNSKGTGVDYNLFLLYYILIYPDMLLLACRE